MKDTRERERDCHRSSLRSPLCKSRVPRKWGMWARQVMSEAEAVGGEDVLDVDGLVGMDPPPPPQPQPELRLPTPMPWTPKTQCFCPT